MEREELIKLVSQLAEVINTLAADLEKCADREAQEGFDVRASYLYGGVRNARKVATEAIVRAVKEG